MKKEKVPRMYMVLKVSFTLSCNFFIVSCRFLQCHLVACGRPVNDLHDVLADGNTWHLNIISLQDTFGAESEYDHQDGEKGNLLPPLHGLLFLISAKGSFMCSIGPQVSTYHSLCYTSCGWNKKELELHRSTMRDRSDIPLHRQWTLLQIYALLW